MNRKLQSDFHTMRLQPNPPTSIDSLKGTNATTTTTMSTVNADDALSGFITQLTAYIPTEIVAGYVALLAFIPVPSWAVTDMQSLQTSADSTRAAAAAADGANSATESAANAAATLARQLPHSSAATFQQLAEDAVRASNSAHGAALSASQAAKNALLTVTQDSKIESTLWLLFWAFLILSPLLQYTLIASKATHLHRTFFRKRVRPHRRHMDFPWFPVLASAFAFGTWSLVMPHSIVAHHFGWTQWTADVWAITLTIALYGVNALLNRAGIASPPPAAVQLAPFSPTMTLLHKSPAGDTVSYVPMPTVFDPSLADDATLQRFGYPSRPNDLTQLQQWTAIYGGQSTFITPTLTSSNSGSSASIQASQRLNNWAGAVGMVKPGVVDAITTTFVIPDVEPPSGATEDAHVMFWIGIDGDAGTSDVLQAGVHCIVAPSGYRKVTSFVEWAPEFEQMTNLPVAIGDTVQCTVRATSRTTGSILLRNVQTNQSLPWLHLTAARGQTVVGNTCEWIAERPIEAGAPALLAKFAPVTFTGCRAEVSGSIRAPQIGDAVEMAAQGGPALVTAAVSAAGNVECSYQ